MSCLADTIWITWEQQRRTETLAKALEIPLYRFRPVRIYSLKVLLLSLRTLLVLLSKRPRRLVVQNPSMALAGLVCWLKPLFGYRLVIDRHSNFKFPTMESRSLKYRLFHALSRMTVARADLTIVTNGHLAGIVEGWGGRPYVLQDMMPTLTAGDAVSLSGRSNIAWVNSFSADEPVEAVLDAAKYLPDGVTLHITGDDSRLSPALLSSVPDNVRLTGYLHETDFQSLLKSVDVVLALTRQDHTLLCSAYEAVALGKPLVLADTHALREYFNSGVLFTSLDPETIAATLCQALEERTQRAQAVEELRERLLSEWKPRFEELIDRVAAL